MPNTQRLPSLRALRTFEVVARLMSIKDAADALHITPSAVSHQIKGLEDFLDMDLLIRKTRAIELTPAGRRYAAYLSEMFARLEAETHQLRAEYGRKLIRICVPPLFSSEILMPRMEQLNNLLPDMDIKISSLPSGMSEHPADADLSVLLGNNNWPSLKTYPLFAGHLVIAAAPELMADFDTSKYQSLNGQTLIVHENRADAWSHWAKELGIKEPTAKKILRFDSMTAVMQAIAGGLGFGIVYWPLSDRWFTSNQIVRVFDTKTITKEYFYLVHRAGDEKRPEIKKIVDWLQYELQHNS